MIKPKRQNILQELDGVQQIYKFPNGYGASVVKHIWSYGGKDNLWELAVLKGKDLCYNSPVTSDVLGWLTDDDVQRALKEIRALAEIAKL